VSILSRLRGAKQETKEKREEPALDPETRKFVEKATAKGPPLYKLSVQQAREVLSRTQAGDVPPPPADIEDRTIPGGPTGAIAIRIVRPKDNRDKLPVVVYLHGAGWVMGGKDTHDRLVRTLANGATATFVFVDYARAPEARYPTANEQAYTALKWVVENSTELNVDSSRLALAGDSVGGNMVAAVTLMAKERGGPPIRFQVLFYPVTNADFETSSYKQFAEGPWLTRKGMKWFWDNYLPEVGMRREHTASPLRATIDQLRGLPPALVITDENDVLRDEGEAYARKLMRAGVRVEATRYLGTIHDFVMLNAIAETPASRAAVAQASDTLRHELH
jgi:acetyl esterase